MRDVTQLLSAAEQGDPKAAQELLPLVYEELRRIAVHKMSNEAAGHTLQPTALVHEAWLRLAGSDGQARFANRAHFFAAAAEAMRRILVESARRRARLKRGGGLERITLDGLPVAAQDRDEKLLEMDEALRRLEKEHPDKARVVKLKFFVGLTNQQVAEALGVTERTVERAWAHAKASLVRSMRARS
jgi:RNA polymerase sigma factor (TIGR02999 family)